MLKYNNMHDVVVDGLAEAELEELFEELEEREGQGEFEVKHYHVLAEIVSWYLGDLERKQEFEERRG